MARSRSPLGLFARFVARLAALASVIVAGGTAIAVCLSLMVPGAGTMASSVEMKAPKLPAANRLKERSVVYDRNGAELAVWKSEENRVVVPFASVPKHVVDAILAVEDANFYQHGGLSVKATGRAMVENLSTGNIEQGGSTITQQLIKISFLNRDKNLDRKVREARLAIELEKEMTKDEILELYLNSVYFGGGAYGVEAAANHYFSKSVTALTVGDAAFLAGMIRNPTGYDPVRFRDRSRQRRTIVLRRMVDAGVLTQVEADQLSISPMPFPAKSAEVEIPNTYFVEQVKQELLDDPRLGDTEGERYQSVFNGGLRVFTTFDPKLQQAAEEAVRDVIPDRSEDEFTASLVSVDVNTGAVRAMAAGRGFATDRFNLVTQARRQPGSSWKPFTLIAALEAGYSIDSTISGNESCPIPNPGGELDPYVPSNYSDSAGFTGSLVDQLVNSSNCAFARLNHIVGTRNVIDVARRLGITSTLDVLPSLALGSEEVRPIEMVGAYATIARDGEFIKPYLVERVEDVNGNVLWTAPTKGKQVIDRDVARSATRAMREVVRRGTATDARLGNDRQIAGKTGTTQNYEDAWFVGYTAQIATAVWMGSPIGKVPMRNVGGIAVSGGSYPTRIWRAYMKVATDNQRVVDFPDPAGKVGKSTCLQLDKPKSGYKSWRPDSSDAKKRSSGSTKKSTKKKSTSNRSSTDRVTPQRIGPVGRFSVLASLDPMTELDPIGEPVIEPVVDVVPLQEKSSKKTTKRKRSGCASWGDEFGSGTVKSSEKSSDKATSKSSSKSTKKSSSKSTSKSTTKKKTSTAKKKKKAPSEDAPTPVPVPEPAPAPEPAPNPEPVPVEAPPAAPPSE